MPYRLRELKSLLAERRSAAWRSRNGGWGIDPAEVRRKLALRGSKSATLVVARIGRRVVAILAQRVTIDEHRAGEM